MFRVFRTKRPNNPYILVRQCPKGWDFHHEQKIMSMCLYHIIILKNSGEIHEGNDAIFDDSMPRSEELIDHGLYGYMSFSHWRTSFLSGN